MKASWKIFGVLLLAASTLAPAVRAGQQVYLSTSPNERYRVYVEQVIDRRVGDRVFFRYPVMLVNVKRPDHHFWIMDVGSPLIKETDRGTFKVNWNGSNTAPVAPAISSSPEPGDHGMDRAEDPAQPTSIHFDWAPDSLKFFIQLEVIEGGWKTFFVDVNSGKSEDVTADMEQFLYEKTNDWDCEEPRFELVKWTKPTLAFFRLTSRCSKSKDQPSSNVFNQKDSILFDTELGRTVDDCMDCKDEKSVKAFDKFYLKTLPTPTPTPEETPTAQ